MIITLYETNSDVLVLARGAVAWSMGAPDRDYLNGSFAEDAEAWHQGQWEPGQSSGQVPTWVGDDLTPVATWDADGVHLLVGLPDMGAAARIYLTGT